jgi:hypothetical protein
VHDAGLEDDFPPGLTIPDRFARLRRWEAAWNNLDAMAPSGGRFELKDLPIMRRTSMLRDGFLILCWYLKRPLEDNAGMPGHSMANLRSPHRGFQTTNVGSDPLAFEFSIEQNMVAMLQMWGRFSFSTILLMASIYVRGVDGGKKCLDLLLWPLHEVLDCDISRLGPIRFAIGYTDNDLRLWFSVDLKIAREFVAVMACGIHSDNTDSFILVNWKIKNIYRVSIEIVTILHRLFATIITVAYAGYEHPYGHVCSDFLPSRSRYSCLSQFEG